MSLRTISHTLLLLLLAALPAFAACTTAGAPRADGLDATKIPSDVRADYEVFAQRCSKCHSLARPLNSGIDDEAYWSIYVARMRRMPSSGISYEDEAVILRFLHYYSIEQRRLKAERAQGTEKPTPNDEKGDLRGDGGAVSDGFVYEAPTRALDSSRGGGQ
ncbi:MAG: hypothetical protein NVS3B20_21400 [Polyangiales bacterium]